MRSSLRPRAAFFIQPHYDDVALSCGATAAMWAAQGLDPQIITVFASELVDEMVGEFAAWKHARWKLGDPDAVHAVRRQEDERAARALGCAIRWLGMPDAIYRGERYASDAALYGPLHDDEFALADHLAEELIRLPEWRDGCQVFVPLAAGSHVDHQLVFEAGARLAARGVEVWAYEDLPYAIHTPASVTHRLKELDGRLGEGVAHPIAEYLAQKMAAIEAYASQLPVIFRFTTDFSAAVQDHARLAGGPAGPAECFWAVKP